MILADVHTHTAYAHGSNTVQEMFDAGQRRGLLLHGFSEHSPRPDGYDYPVEYREKLALAFPAYIREVRDLARRQAEIQEGDPPEKKVTVLLGVELDWFETELDFMQGVLDATDFDYVIGGIHFLGTWGFDHSPAEWEDFNADELDSMYTRYYQTMARMAKSGLFNIVAHPDLIKIFTKPSFDAWLNHEESLYQVERALKAIKAAGMAMEISSAGLRKPCAEIYPGPVIMEMAADLGLSISFGSDGHCVHTIGKDFDRLADYAAHYGWKESLVFNRGRVLSLPF